MDMPSWQAVERRPHRMKRSSYNFWVLILVFLWWVFLLTVFVLPPALAHEWYPADCCSGNDCEEVKVYEGADGYRFEHPMKKGVTVFMPYNGKYRFSQDGKFHACYWRDPNSNAGNMVNPDGKPCFIVPPRSG